MSYIITWTEEALSTFEDRITYLNPLSQKGNNKLQKKGY